MTKRAYTTPDAVINLIREDYDNMCDAIATVTNMKMHVAQEKGVLIDGADIEIFAKDCVDSILRTLARTVIRNEQAARVKGTPMEGKDESGKV